MEFKLVAEVEELGVIEADEAEVLVFRCPDCKGRQNSIRVRRPWAKDN